MQKESKESIEQEKNKYAVFLAHLVKLVNANDTAVGKDHRSPFEIKLARGRVLDGIVRRKKQRTSMHTRTTLAVRPAALEPFPDV